MQHLKYHDRVLIEFEISENPESTLKSVAEKLGVSRSTVMREILRNSTVTKSKAISLSFRGPKAPQQPCPLLRKWPYCCNRCAKTNCPRTRLHYRAAEADRTSRLVNAKAARKPSRETLRRAAEVEEKVVPMLMAGNSIEAAVRAVGCDVHPTTIRRWIDRNLISPSRVDLPRAAKFRPKALYDYSKAKRSEAPARVTFGSVKCKIIFTKTDEITFTNRDGPLPSFLVYSRFVGLDAIAFPSFPPSTPRGSAPRPSMSLVL